MIFVGNDNNRRITCCCCDGACCAGGVGFGGYGLCGDWDGAGLCAGGTIADFNKIASQFLKLTHQKRKTIRN